MLAQVEGVGRAGRGVLNSAYQPCSAPIPAPSSSRDMNQAAALGGGDAGPRVECAASASSLDGKKRDASRHHEFD